MSLMATIGTVTADARTGLPVRTGSAIMTTLTGDYMATNPTGAAKGTVNTFPGTDANAPGDDDPGLPYGFASTPGVGPLTSG